MGAWARLSALRCDCGSLPNKLPTEQRAVPTGRRPALVEFACCQFPYEWLGVTGIRTPGLTIALQDTGVRDAGTSHGPKRRRLAACFRALRFESRWRALVVCRISSGWFAKALLAAARTRRTIVSSSASALVRSLGSARFSRRALARLSSAATRAIRAASARPAASRSGAPVGPSPTSDRSIGRRAPRTRTTSCAERMRAASAGSRPIAAWRSGVVVAVLAARAWRTSIRARFAASFKSPGGNGGRAGLVEALAAAQRARTRYASFASRPGSIAASPRCP